MHKFTNLKDFQRAALRTAKRVDERSDLNHAALGFAGEAGEFADCVKRFTVYGKQLDRGNAIEEIGDLLWYCAYACEALGVDLDEVAAQNLFKLSMRYPEQYSDLLAIKRMDKDEAR